MIEYTGALHIHSNFSDGSGTVPEIAKAAGEIGLDFFILTDHNTLRALDEGYEKWYGNTLCLVGCEINDKENKNHYLAFGINETYSTRMSAKNYVKKVKEAGGIGFLAHPHEKRTHMKEHPPYPWIEWDTNDFTGIEIWNHMSEWMENLTEQNKYQSFLHPLKTIEAPPPETLKLWDELNLQRRVVGIGGIDAHAHKQNLFGFFEVEIFPYKVLFKSIRTHILLDNELKRENTKQNITRSKKLIYKALEEGKCFIANDYHADSKGFKFFAQNSKNKFQMGEKLPFSDDITLNISVPVEKAEIQIVRNSECIFKVLDGQTQFKVQQEGIYRVQVYLLNKAWIFSNHIRIGMQ
jgi:hypothetical protein